MTSTNKDGDSDKNLGNRESAASEVRRRLPDSHPADQDLLLAADGELPPRRAEELRIHLAACWNCRARMAEIESTIADFARAHRQALDARLPPIAGPRALLRAQLCQLSSQPQANSWRSFLGFMFGLASSRRATMFACTAVLIAGAAWAILLRHPVRWRSHSAAIAFEQGAEPNRNLTPGATRRVVISDVCSRAHEDVVREVSTSLRQEVFQEYGIVNPRADDYEIDYLIAPGLGGAEDIHNLWPESYSSRTWNAHVKDALEERLHEMVCSGAVDLSTAQSEIATDWISAYKKYFHTDKPLSVRSQMTAEQNHGKRS